MRRAHPARRAIRRPENDASPMFTPLKPSGYAAVKTGLLEVPRGRRSGFRRLKSNREMFGPATILSSAVCPSQHSGTRRHSGRSSALNPLWTISRAETAPIFSTHATHFPLNKLTKSIALGG
jgi:hypothetical protein